MKAKLAFRNEESGNLVYVSFSSKGANVVEIPDTIDVYHPEISPDGQRVAFCTSSEGESGRSSIYVRDLDDFNHNLVKLDVEGGAAIPRWRVKPNGDTVIVYVTSPYNNEGAQFEQESTWEVPFANRKFGVPQKLFNGAYHGGISDDDRLAVSGSTRLRARIVSDQALGNDVIWYEGEQACNASLSKDGSKRTISTDPLTSLNNRNQLRRYLYLQRDPKSSYVIMVDVDHFKQINDTYGHVEGDRALVLVSQALKKACSRLKISIFLCRYGGDEFMLIARTKKPEDVVKLIRECLDEEIMNRKGSQTYKIEVSMGYARWSGRVASFKDSVAAADQKMYEDKRSAVQPLEPSFQPLASRS